MTPVQLARIVPACKDPERWAGRLNNFMPKFDIIGKQRVAPFIANIAHESASFNAMKEYASGTAYDVGQLAVKLGNTPEDDGDGEKYKGRGLIQITGRSMYSKCSAALFGNAMLLTNPELLEHPDNATASACWYWSKEKGINFIADKPDNWIKPGKHGYTKQEWICILINGGLNGYDDRMKFLKRANEIL